MVKIKWFSVWRNVHPLHGLLEKHSSSMGTKDKSGYVRSDTLPKVFQLLHPVDKEPQLEHSTNCHHPAVLDEKASWSSSFLTWEMFAAFLQKHGGNKNQFEFIRVDEKNQ